MNPLFKYLAGAVGAIILFMIFAPFTTVPAGSRGVVTHFGKVQDEVLDEGIHFTTPIVTSVHKISVRVLKSTAETEAATKDMQKVRAQLTINWHVNAAKVNDLYRSIGDESAVEANVISPAVSEVLKAASAKMTAEEVLTKRIELKTNIDDSLKARLMQYNVVVDDISLTDLDFTKEFNHAVEQKQIAEQEAKQAEYVANKATVDARAAVEKAKGEAQAELTRAESKAKAQRLLQTTLTPAILQMEALKKWDGSFPQVMGSGSMPFLNLKLNGAAKD